MRDESATGYLLRLSEVNGFTSLLDLDFLVTRQTGDDGLAKVKAMLPGVSLQRLRGYVTRFRNLKTIDPGCVDVKYWNGRTPRFCPTCLLEEPYWRAAWDLTLMVACPIHSVRLRDSCSVCHRPLSWKRGRISECDCGQPLSDMPSEKASPAALAVSAYLTIALTGEPVVDKIQKHSSILCLSLPDLLAVCTQFGGYASSHGAKPTKIAHLDDVLVATVVATSAGYALIDWPNGYYELLRNIGRNARAENSLSRLTARFGYFYTALYRRFSAKQFDFLRQEFEAFVRGEWVGQLAERNRRLSKATRHQHAWIPITRAAKQLGIKRSSMLALISNGTLEGHIAKTASGRSRATVSKDSLEVLRQTRASWMTLKQVRVTLGISRKRAYYLLNSGALCPVSGPTVDGAPVWRFLSRDVLALDVPAGARLAFD
jgi:hypothetical protein